MSGVLSKEVAVRLGITNCEFEATDGISVASEVAIADAGSDATMPLLDGIENTEGMSLVEGSVSIEFVPVSRGSRGAVADADKPSDDISVVKGVTWESTLGRLMVVEKTIDTSVTRPEIMSIELRVSDWMLSVNVATSVGFAESDIPESRDEVGSP